MADDKKYIKKIKLSDANGNEQIRYVYDCGAPRQEELNNYLPLTGGTVTGNLTIDQQLQAGTLKIISIEYQSDATDNVLIQKADGTIMKRSTENLLEDIGGCSYSMDDSTGTLSFKIGK